MRRQILAATLALAGLATSPAGAVDGVKLISQPKSFPIAIEVPGTYRLKKNITVPDANTTAILIVNGDVTLDLNGFSIIGPTVCSGTPVTGCAPTGTGVGIDVQSVTNENITIVNGTVRGMGNTGINSPFRGARIEGVHAISNGSSGIIAGDSCTIIDSLADSNGGNGMQVGADCSVTGSISINNNGIGVATTSGSLVTGNAVSSNGADGIFALQGSSVAANAVRANINFGLDLGSTSAYAGNVQTGNNGGGETQGSGGTQFSAGTNFCGSDTTCP
jgi:hypothetical protein